MTDSRTRTCRITLASETDLAGWRKKARQLLEFAVPPEQVVWTVEGRAETASLDMFGETAFSPGVGNYPGRKVTIARALLATINTALLNSVKDRFALAYDIVFRARTEPKLHRNPADAGVKRLNALAKSVRRDIHKMHAFVRFRKIGEEAGRERFVAWFEPDHHIVEAVAPFFRNRFAGMDWLIVTPEASIAWDGTRLRYGPGGTRSDVPESDVVEDEWRTYYASIFNPARVKIQAMKSEMPVKYWKNLPEAELIVPLIRESARRVDRMLTEQRAPALFVGEAGMTDAASFVSLDALYDALAASRDMPEQDFSKTIVRGEGPADASILIVGEQPGDREDLAGRPFVGPAGQMLDRALAEAGIERRRAYLTNAVKRFKFTPRGKRRIHQTPNAGEIRHYRWWLDQERKLVKPDIVIALGATAARALIGKPAKISQFRGQRLDYADKATLIVTVHPSYLLRLPDKNGRRIERGKFIRDLRLAT